MSTSAKVDPNLPWSGGVAITTAILAALAAIASVFGQRNTTEAMIDQIETSDQWSYYQAKGIKLAVIENKMEMFPALKLDPTDDDKARSKRYAKEQEDIKIEAQKHQVMAQDHRRRASFDAQAGSCAQVGIALAAIALLLKRRPFWFASIAFGLGAITLLLYAFFSPGAAAVF